MKEKFTSRKFIVSMVGAIAMYVPSIVSWAQSNPSIWERYGGLILGTSIIVNWACQETRVDQARAQLSPAQLNSIYGTGEGEAHAMPSLAEVEALENLGGPADSGHVEKPAEAPDDSAPSAPASSGGG